MNKKQLEAFHENQKEINRLNRLKSQYEAELKPQSKSVVNLVNEPLMVGEFRFGHVIAEKILYIEDRIKQLTMLNQQVITFIDSLKDQERNMLTDVYIKQMPRQKCANKYYCDVRTISRMIDRILLENYPYEVVL